MKDQTIGLLMLVRDEELVLPETLPSVAPLISQWIMLDTGSHDRSEQVAKRLLDGIPGAYVHSEWKGFAGSRNELIELALEQAFGAPHYWLMLDADMRVELSAPLPRLTEDVYSIRIAGDFEMWLPLMFGSDVCCRFEGRAHATLRWDDPDVTQGYLEELAVRELRSNSPRGDDKFRSDLAELERELDARSVFYYAQTLKDLGHVREAADMYRIRVRLSAEHPQEVFWACYQEGLLRFELGGRKAAAPIMLEAYARRPTRAEPLWWLAHHYRMAGEFAPALLFAEKAAAIPKPTDRHFMLAWVYEWGAKQELALCLQALRRFSEAVDLFEELVALAPNDAVVAFARERLRSIPAVV